GPNVFQFPKDKWRPRTSFGVNYDCRMQLRELPTTRDILNRAMSKRVPPSSETLIICMISRWMGSVCASLNRLYYYYMPGSDWCMSIVHPESINFSLDLYSSQSNSPTGRLVM